MGSDGVDCQESGCSASGEGDEVRTEAARRCVGRGYRAVIRHTAAQVDVAGEVVGLLQVNGCPVTCDGPALMEIAPVAAVTVYGGSELTTTDLAEDVAPT